jgi:hypothetical protein
MFQRYAHIYLKKYYIVTFRRVLFQIKDFNDGKYIAHHFYINLLTLILKYHLQLKLFLMLSQIYNLQTNIYHKLIYQLQEGSCLATIASCLLRRLDLERTVTFYGDLT